MIRDNFSNFKFFQALETENYDGNAGVSSGAQIDLQGYEAATIVFTIGDYNSISTVSYTDLILQHGLLESDLGASAWSDVPHSQMIHSTYSRGDVTSTGLVKCLNDSGLGSTVYIVGYKGKARYLRVQVSANATTESALVGVVAVLGYPANWPVNEPA